MAGCAGPISDLPDVPIVGGSPEVVAELRLELSDFDVWSGAGRVHLRRVLLTSLDGTAIGKFKPSTSSILIDDALTPLDARIVLRHELCHALDSEERLLEAPLEVFDRWSAGVVVEDDVAAWEEARSARSELLAEACEVGPIGATALSFPCVGDHEALSDVAAWVESNVWQGVTPDIAAPPTMHASFEPPIESWWTISLSPTEVESALKWAASTTDGSPADFVIGAVDLDTGELLPPWPIIDGVPDETFAPHDVPLGAMRSEIAIGWVDGPAAILATYTIEGLDPSDPRGVLYDGTTWRATELCFPEQTAAHAFFTARAELWTAWEGEHMLSWGSLGFPE